MITRMDRDIGRLMALLKELGLDDKTLVFFASDNGAVFPAMRHRSRLSSGATAICAASSRTCTKGASARPSSRAGRAGSRRARPAISSARSGTCCRPCARSPARRPPPTPTASASSPRCWASRPEAARSSLLGIPQRGRAAGRAFRRLEGRSQQREESARARRPSCTTWPPIPASKPTWPRNTPTSPPRRPPHEIQPYAKLGTEVELPGHRNNGFPHQQGRAPGNISTKLSHFASNRT